MPADVMKSKNANPFAAERALSMCCTRVRGGGGGIAQVLDDDIATWLHHAAVAAVKCGQTEQAQMAAGYFAHLKAGTLFGDPDMSGSGDDDDDDGGPGPFGPVCAPCPPCPPADAGYPGIKQLRNGLRF